MNKLVHFISRRLERIGKEVSDLFVNVAGLFSLAMSVLYSIFSLRLDLYATLKMTLILIAETAHLTAFISGFSGAVSVFHAISSLSFANEISIGTLIHLAVIKELSPIMVGMAINNRYCSYITAKIASMKTSEQLSVIKVFGIDQYKTIFAPMIFAATVAGPILVIVAAVAGSWGGIIVATTKGKLSSSVIEVIIASITSYDLVVGAIKGMIFGFFSSCIACYFGVNSIPNSHGIGRSVTKAIVYGFVTVFLLDLLLTIVM